MEQTTAVADTTSKTGDTVLIAVDGSDFSDYAFQFYVEDLHKPGNKVVLAHSTDFKCSSKPAVSIMSGDPALIQSEIQSEEKKTDALVEKIAAKLAELSLDAKIERIHGEAGHAIVQLAESLNADYIVVGCRGKGTIRRTFTGSVTDFIVHHSNAPVLVARNKEHIEQHRFHFHLNPFHQDRHHKQGHHGEEANKGKEEKTSETEK